jgi:transposase-like protein
MGRKSALTVEQWLEIERRHVVDGDSINALAAEFGINESSIRRKIKPNKAESPKPTNPLRVIAEKKVNADSEVRRINQQIAELPYAKQMIVSDLATKLTNISRHLGSAAEFGAATAHRLAGIANGRVAQIDDAKPLSEAGITELKGIAVLTKLANEASEIGINLLRANKESIDAMNKPETDSAQLLKDIAAHLPD